MHSLINNILNLPALSLNTTDWLGISNIVKNVKLYTTEELQLALSTESIRGHLKDIIRYLQVWHAVAENFAQLQRTINEESKSNPLNDQDLLLLAILLLPENYRLLTQIRNKLAQAAMLNVDTQLNADIARLYTAANMKLETTTFSHDRQQLNNESRANINPILTIILKEQIDKLIAITDQHKNDMTGQFTKRLKMADSLAYQANFTSDDSVNDMLAFAKAFKAEKAFLSDETPADKQDIALQFIGDDNKNTSPDQQKKLPQKIHSSMIVSHPKLETVIANFNAVHQLSRLLCNKQKAADVMCKYNEISETMMNNHATRFWASSKQPTTFYKIATAVVNYFKNQAKINKYQEISLTQEVQTRYNMY